MKKFTTSLLALSLLLLFSCSSDDDGSNSEGGIPEQGNISLALSNGAGFPVENISAVISNLYGDTINTADILITGTAGASGNIVIDIIDEDNSFRAITNESAFPVGDPSETIFASINYNSDSFNLQAEIGVLEIISYEEFPEQGYALLSATFSVSDFNFNSITSSILDIVLICQNC